MTNSDQERRLPQSTQTTCKEDEVKMMGKCNRVRDSAVTHPEVSQKAGMEVNDEAGRRNQTTTRPQRPTSSHAIFSDRLNDYWFAVIVEDGLSRPGGTVDGNNADVYRGELYRRGACHVASHWADAFIQSDFQSRYIHTPWTQPRGATRG